MSESGILSFLFIVLGLFPIIASIANWDWFFNHRKAKIILKLFGRNGARVFYSILGLTIVTVGFLSAIGYISLE